MPEAQKQEELSVTTDDDLKVEIVDDTPEKDRGRQPLPKEVKEELENDDLEEYSEKVKKRIAQARKAWHDERREKETASREREEALNFAARVFEENKLLKRRMSAGEQIFATEMNASAKASIEAARVKLKEAYDSGDSEKIALAQEALTDAKLKEREAANFKPTPLQEDESVVQTPQRSQVPARQAAPQVDPKARAWQEENTWFGTNKGMTSFALGLHEELVENGIDPKSDEYFEQINRTMRKRFPEEFDDSDRDDARETKPERNSRAPLRKPTTVVAPATRSTAPKTVHLTQSELALAKKFNLTPEQYAREKLKLEQNNG